MNITKAAIHNNRVTFGILVSIIFMGLVAYQSMPRDDMPPFTIKFCTIVTFFPGASPERVEMLVSDKIEKAIQEMPEVDFITSENRTGVSIVMVAIKDSETKMRPIFDEVRRKVEDIKLTLPEGIIGPEVKDELGTVYGILVGLTGDGFTYSELKDIADDVRDELIKLPNAAKVEIAGDQEERIFIEYDDAKLSQYGLSRQAIMMNLSATNIIIPGGDIVVGNEQIILEPTGNFQTIEDLKKIIIRPGNTDKIVYLGDITTIYRGYVDPPAGIVRINGQQGLVLGISVKKGGNIIRLGKEIDEKMGHFNSIYPIGIEFQRVASQDIVVNDSVNDFVVNVVQSIAVVLLVMFLFLGFRTGLIVASLIPFTIIVTLFIMSRIDVGLNQVSLASLIIALGMLVDNAIVISESIMVKIKNGEKPFDAAIQSSKELLLPLLIASLTTSAAFLAFFLAESVWGEIMGQIFIVVSLSLLCSWIISLTIIPMFCMYFLKYKKDKAKKAPSKASGFDKMESYYKKFLIRNLKRPYFVTLFIIGFFILTIFLFSHITFMFFPDSERAIVSANIELPLGTRIERTEEVITHLEDYIHKHLLVNDEREEGILSWSSYIGEGAPSYDLGYQPPEASPNTAHILINTTSNFANDIVIEQLDSLIFSTYPEVRATVGRLGQGGTSADPIAIRISGKDPDKLFLLVDSIKSQLRSIHGTKNIKDSWGARTKKLLVNINQAKAQLAGVTSQDIAISLQTLLSGTYTGEFREDDKTIPIILRNEEARRQDIGKLESMNIFAQQSGKNVPLKQVADIKLDWQYSKILRRDQNRTVTITSGVKKGYNAAKIMGNFAPWLKNYQKSWAYGYKYAIGGEQEDSAEGMNSVARNLPLSFFIILLLLIGQFNSIRKTVIVLLTIPLGIIGVSLGLFIANSYYGFMAFLGIISLSGIVINNAIVLLDRIQIELNEFNKSPQQAIVDAAKQRFRPILLTTFTTALGLIPLWVSGGIMWQPMAIAIIFGLLFATVITLLFVPVVYKTFFRVSFRRVDIKTENELK